MPQNRGLLDRTAQFISVHFRHLDVRHDNVRLERLNEFQCQFTIESNMRVVARRDKTLLKHFPLYSTVFGYNNDGRSSIHESWILCFELGS